MGRRRGAILPIVPRNQAKVMVKRGLAVYASEIEGGDMRNADLCEDLPIDAPPEEPKPVVKKKTTRKKKKALSDGDDQS